jgi:hypothetical protein
VVFRDKELTASIITRMIKEPEQSSECTGD